MEIDARDWRRRLQPGDQVTWNDPDDGICSRALTIRVIVFGDEDTVSIMDTDGNHLEAFLRELS